MGTEPDPDEASPHRAPQDWEAVYIAADYRLRLEQIKALANMARIVLFAEPGTLPATCDELLGKIINIAEDLPLSAPELHRIERVAMQRHESAVKRWERERRAKA